MVTIVSISSIKNQVKYYTAVDEALLRSCKVFKNQIQVSSPNLGEL